MDLFTKYSILKKNVIKRKRKKKKKKQKKEYQCKGCKIMYIDFIE